MKYVKFYPVDAKTGISILKEESKNGPILPTIPGLDNLCVDYYCEWYYGLASDDFVADPDNKIFELTEEEYYEELSNKMELLKKDAINRLYEDEKELREKKLAPYHDTATIAGVQKYQEAKKYVDEGVASEFLTTESEMRGIPVQELCEKIIEKYENFRLLDAKISGLRGKILDRINSFSLDPDNIWESHQEWEERKETLVESRIPTEEYTEPFAVGTPEIVRYYSINLYGRYECMEYNEKYPNIGIATTAG